MKLFKRFAAALLVGVMALAMLTACGGGSAPKSLGQQAEELMMQAMNLAMQADGKESLQNDPTMKNVIYEALGHVDENGKIDAKYLPQGENLENALKTGKAGTITVYEITDKDGSAEVITQESVNEMRKMVEQLKQQLSKQDDGEPANKSEVTDVKKFAVATRVVNGKTYIGMGSELVLTAKASNSVAE